MNEIIVDSFAGGGGTSEGIRLALGRDPDIAINHDAMALAMHRINHPGTRHMVEDVWSIDARSMCDGRPIGLLWLSPDCKHFSKAKGGKPREKEIRGLAWVGVRWVKSLPKRQRPRVVALENVEEFQDWGPLLADGRPCPVQKGLTFQNYIGAWRSLGYVAEWKELRACDYGDPTIRKRLFVILRRDGRPIVWPARTHGNPKDPADAALIAAGRLKPWRTAAEIIDWSLPCPSIFETAAEIKQKWGLRAQRPLKPATMARVAKGTKRYVIGAAEPFIVPVTHAGDLRVHGVDEPLRTQTTAKRGEHALLTPFVTKFNRGATGHGADEPLATVTSHASETHGGGAAPLGIVTPYIVRTDMTSAAGPNGVNEVGEPLRTQTTAPSHAVVAPILVGCGGRAAQSEPRAGDDPVLTPTAKADACIVAPYMVRTAHGDVDANGKRRGRGEHSADEPMPTVLTSNDSAIAAVHLSAYYGQGLGSTDRSAPCDEPARTITVGPRHALVAAHLSTMRNAEKPFQGADQPTHTLTAGGANQALVAAFLAQHNTDMVGKAPDEPLSTIVAKGSTQGVAAAFLSHAYTSNTNGGNGDPQRPLKTVLAGGQHAAAVYAFLQKYYGNEKDGIDVRDPMHTVTTKDRVGLVTVTIGGEPYVISDIGMRMLTPRERFSAQGFGSAYVIDRGEIEDGTIVRFTLEQQGRMCGNSVCPGMARALVAANFVPRQVAARPLADAPLLTAAE